MALATVTIFFWLKLVDARLSPACGTHAARSEMPVREAKRTQAEPKKKLFPGKRSPSPRRCPTRQRQRPISDSHCQEALHSLERAPKRSFTSIPPIGSVERPPLTTVAWFRQRQDAV